MALHTFVVFALSSFALRRFILFDRVLLRYFELVLIALFALFALKPSELLVEEDTAYLPLFALLLPVTTYSSPVTTCATTTPQPEDLLGGSAALYAAVVSFASS